MNEQKAVTQGSHHVGLTVSNLDESAAFFVDMLGWSEVRRNPDYPAIFVSDGVLMLTLWQAQTDKPIAFDRKENIGLHHLALAVASLEELENLHHKFIAHGIRIEFAPELLREGPAKHMMCYEPSGIRLEFIYIPK